MKDKYYKEKLIKIFSLNKFRYGDMAPRSIFARIIVMIWFIAGMVLNSIIIGFVVTNLTSISLPSQFMLYDTKVVLIKLYLF